MGNRAEPLRFVSSVNERRDANRYVSKGAPVLLGWLAGDACRTTSGVLKDVSQSGARIATAAAPATGSSVLIRLPSASFAGVIRAEVVGVAVGRRSWPWLVGRKSYVVRLMFTEPCPYDFFKAAIDGFVRDSEPIVESMFEGFDPGDLV